MCQIWVGGKSQNTTKSVRLSFFCLGVWSLFFSFFFNFLSKAQILPFGVLEVYHKLLSLCRKKDNNTYQGTTWQINFGLDDVKTNGTYKLRLALASAHAAELQVCYFMLIYFLNRTSQCSVHIYSYPQNHTLNFSFFPFPLVGSDKQFRSKPTFVHKWNDWKGEHHSQTWNSWALLAIQRWCTRHSSCAGE